MDLPPYLEELSAFAIASLTNMSRSLAVPNKENLIQLAVRGVAHSSSI
jgi:hypothetical protein